MSEDKKYKTPEENIFVAKPCGIREADVKLPERVYILSKPQTS